MFQGSNIRTKTGISAIELFEEVSNAPASFTGIRCGLAAAVLKKLRVSIRDALQAYLQARINQPGRIETWVELPQEYWPDSWFKDGSKRQIPLYDRPTVLLVLALYGHPESGALWDEVLTTALVSRGWKTIPEWPSVFIHSDFSILIAYVDDLMLCATEELTKKHWNLLDEAIEFKDEGEAISRFIGAHYDLMPFDAKDPNAVREVSIGMCDYVKNMAVRFAEESGLTLRKVATPYIADDQWSADDNTPGRFAKTCSSHVATSLFATRVGRPELSNITQRLCSAVSRWTVVHDAALVRLMSYAFHHSDLKLHGSLSPEDIKDIEIVPYSDADWAGDASTTKSTTGFWLELYSPSSGRSWLISWGAILQTPLYLFGYS